MLPLIYASVQRLDFRRVLVSCSIMATLGAGSKQLFYSNFYAAVASNVSAGILFVLDAGVVVVIFGLGSAVYFSAAHTDVQDVPLFSLCCFVGLHAFPAAELIVRGILGWPVFALQFSILPFFLLVFVATTVAAVARLARLNSTK